MSHNTFQKAWVFLLLFLSISVFFFRSALLPYHHIPMHIDSQVYIYAAQQILEGKILYKDIFDHKGPVMYVLECIGLFFCKNNFIPLWLWQNLFLSTCTMPIVWFSINKYGKWVTAIALLFLFAFMRSYYTIGDNIPEVFAIGFLMLLCYFFQKIKDEEQTKKSFFFMGVISACLFLIKANFILYAFPVYVFCLYIIVHHRNFYYLLIIALGFLVAIVPFAIYFLYHGAVHKAFFAFITYNFSYIHAQKLSITQSIIEVICHKKSIFIAIPFTIAFIVELFYKKSIRKVLYPFVSILFILLTVIGISGRGAQSFHYMLPLCVYVFYISFTISLVKKVLLRYGLFILALLLYMPVLKDVFAKKSDRINDDTLAFLMQNKKSNQSLCILGNHSEWYYKTGLHSNTPFFFTYPIMDNCNEQLTQDFLISFSNNRADWLVIETHFEMPLCITNSVKEKYTLVAENADAQILKK